jgi:hypothetical protein
VSDDARRFELLHRFVDARGARSEHVREELLRHADLRCGYPILHHQKPTGEARFHAVRAVARCGLADLSDERIRKPQQLPLHLAVALEAGEQVLRIHPPSRPLALHDGVVKLGRRVHENVQTDHSFIADDADFHRRS